MKAAAEAEFAESYCLQFIIIIIIIYSVTKLRCKKTIFSLSKSRSIILSWHFFMKIAGRRCMSHPTMKMLPHIPQNTWIRRYENIAESNVILAKLDNLFFTECISQDVDDNFYNETVVGSWITMWDSRRDRKTKTEIFIWVVIVYFVYRRFIVMYWKLLFQSISDINFLNLIHYMYTVIIHVYNNHTSSYCNNKLIFCLYWYFVLTTCVGF